MSIKLKNKAKNIDILKKIFFKNNKIVIPNYFYFQIKQIKFNKDKLINKIYIFNRKKEIILRSSALNEDQSNYSLAGKYDSIVLKKNSEKKFILKKFNSFVKQFENQKDLIIIQEKISDVDYSGVLFSKDINHNSPYYLINYDSTGKTNLITSGAQNPKEKNLIIYKNKKNLKNKFYDLIEATKAIEKKVENDRLDIEFAIKKDKTYLFQLRPLHSKKNKLDIKYLLSDFDNYLLNIKKKLIKLKTKNPILAGKTTFFSNMADWNPAEMIGDKPKHLAVSLYKELITNEVWCEQRELYGYQNVYPNILMFTFAGSPYIDLRTDINSFIPYGLNKKEKEIIINKYLDKIKKNPEIHDKIEFELIETCYSFNSKKRLLSLFKKELANKYLKIIKKQTANILKTNFVEREKSKLQIFENNLKIISKKKISDIQKIFYLTKILKRFGTLPFSGIARCAFISQRILLDLKALNLISESEFKNFFSSIKSITTIFNDKLNNVFKGNIKKGEFINIYGHLRPSTYDINSLNYNEGFSNYFKGNFKYKKTKQSKIKFNNILKLNKLFNKDFNFSFRKFAKFAQQSIFQRENSKLIFSKGINLIFECLIRLGEEVKINRKDLAFVDFNKILNYYSSLEIFKLKKTLKADISKNKYEYEIMKKIKLPDIIINENDIFEFYENKSKPNFITLNKIVGETIVLKKNNLDKIKNKILIIKNADPGYDFIFNHNIKGLITQYGGANSHMAIRCLEYNIPAAIGVGGHMYENIIKSKEVLINCEKKDINILR
jgi:phosphohistidine swiveling domain-containing protein|tara:strand:+ start:2536 stop:4866 length:2331 start_codon:yes stop_codon:yes gene_type:complete